jgi:hypothetical protein
MKRILWTGTAALSLSFSGAAVAQQAGDWALGQWQGGSAWYPGVIMARSGNQVTIRYDDGTSEVRPINQVRPYNWRVGSHIACRFTDGLWYPATITAMAPDGLTISVRYDDGDTQITNTGRCRVD